MDAEALRQRLRAGENLTTEFKAAGIHPDDLAAALVAFANTSGGEIIFGAGEPHKLPASNAHRNDDKMIRDKIIKKLLNYFVMK